LLLLPEEVDREVAEEELPEREVLELDRLVVWAPAGIAMPARRAARRRARRRLLRVMADGG
jgi:hypothetical protein